MNQIVDATKVKPISECTTVAELLADPARWTKKCSAKDKDGYPITPGNEKATCFCIIGAVGRIYPGRVELDIIEKLQQAIDYPGMIHDWNDAPERTHAEVLDLVRRAGI